MAPTDSDGARENGATTRTVRPLANLAPLNGATQQRNRSPSSKDCDLETTKYTHKMLQWKKKSKTHCWIWKAMLDLRDRICNGEQVLMWYDRWSKIDPLSQYISKRNIYVARLSDKATVAD
nr:hypothetical protein [Tanacetum cinerariifolium]